MKGIDRNTVFALRLERQGLSRQASTEADYIALFELLQGDWIEPLGVADLLEAAVEAIDKNDGPGALAYLTYAQELEPENEAVLEAIQEQTSLKDRSFAVIADEAYEIAVALGKGQVHRRCSQSLEGVDIDRALHDPDLDAFEILGLANVPLAVGDVPELVLGPPDPHESFGG